MKLKTFLRRQVALVSAVSLAATGVLPLLVNGGIARAATVTERSITLSSSKISAASTTYAVSFKPATSTGSGADDIKGIVVDFCTSPLIGVACTHPTGMSGIAVSGTFPVAHTGATGTPVSFTAQNPAGSADDGVRLLLTDSTGLDVITTANPITFSFTATNPSTLGSFYARILTYNSTAGATSYTDTVPGTHLDEGGIALSTANQLSVSARVQEQLQFCVGTTTVDTVSTNTAPGTVSTDCGTSFTGSAGNTVDLGVLDSSNVYVSGPSNTSSANNGVNGAAMVRTNANNGVAISFYAEAGSGSNHLRSLRVSGATCDTNATIPSTDNTDQCFNSAGATQTTFTSGVENFGMTIAGVNCTDFGAGQSTTSYTCHTFGTDNHLVQDTNYVGNTTSAYGTSTGFAWPETSTATTIAHSASVVDDESIILKFAGTANITTPTGSYGVTSTYIATATF